MLLRFLLKRPIAILMSFFALIIFSVLAFMTLPVSLLPAIEVPEIIIKINYPNRGAEEIEEEVLGKLRSSILTLNNIEDIESHANNQSGIMRLQFSYNTNMKLVYLEVNEKIDQSMNMLPRDLPRPQVVRVNTSDIPIIKLQIIPKNAKNDLLEVSDLAEKVIKKRLAQIKGVSLIDINGVRERVIKITPKTSKMQAWKIKNNQIREAIRNNNFSLGSVSLKDGNYRYDVKIITALKNIDDIKTLQIQNVDSNLISLNEIADIEEDLAEKQGTHLFNTKEAIVLNIHKQNNTQLGTLMPKLKSLKTHFETDYPKYKFIFTQDQSLLLNVSIDNLKSSLFWGALFAFLVLFLFMRNYKIPIIIGISLPSSLFLSFLVFYAFQISFNIISLSGLALGLGMLIDNGIIIIDNIRQKQMSGKPILDCCVEGTLEMISPLISSVLTTLAVFIPLIFVSGIAGALFYEQAIAIAAILLSALLVSFVLIPLIYLFFKPKILSDRQNKPFYLIAYKKLYQLVFLNKTISTIILLLLLPLAYILFIRIPKENLPKIRKTETLVYIDWNENISLEENKHRVQQLSKLIHHKLSETEVGTNDFLLSQEKGNIQETTLYFSFKNPYQRKVETPKIKNFLQQEFPKAKYKIKTAVNAFEQLFENTQAFIHLKFRSQNPKKSIQPKILHQLIKTLSKKYKWQKGKGSQETSEIALDINQKSLLHYQINYNTVINKLKSLFGNYQLDYIRSYGNEIPILLGAKKENASTQIKHAQINNVHGEYYPLKRFVKHHYLTKYNSITADKLGIYHGLESNDKINPNTLEQTIKPIVNTYGVQLDVKGNFIAQEKNLNELSYILFIALILLYFILAAQFESFWQPLLVIFSLGLGLVGSLLLLMVTGQSLNIMASIGIIISLGIMVNDTILKIDSINRYRKTLGIEKALVKAGESRLQAILMTSITTILALLPILFSSGIGADLQKSLVIAVIGALSIGTIMALYFIPLSFSIIFQKQS